jgi:transcription initiation factor TFIIIB Brf1 subunit/transcription initiation factor TFIIB
MRATLLKLLPKNEQTLIDRILNKVKEWLGMEIQIDGERILKLVDRIVRNAEKKEAKTDPIAYIQKNIGNLVMPMEIIEKLEKKVISKEALDKIVEMVKCKGS